jgi:hypothetical protein
MQRCFSVVLLYLLLTVSCTPAPEQKTLPPLGSCSLDLGPSVADEEAIQRVLTAEGEFVVEQKIDALMNLWHEGATVADAKNTPDKLDDDQTWLDKDAIRHRYVRIVFPGAPTQADPKDLEIAINADRAIITATTNIGTEISPGGDRWVLVKQNGCWEIESLTYNLEAQQR